jgi:outer membrane protein assembly factor BamA
VGLAKNPLSPTDDPSTGQRWQGDIREEYTIIARTTALFFTRMSAEAAMYRPIGDFLVVAIQGQAGYIAAANDQAFLIPPAERFYGGGQSSVRGYDENLLGPGSYIVSQTQYKDSTLANGSHIGIAQTAAGYSRIAPSGGNAMWLANVEFRTRHGWPTEILRWVFFVDAGRVWNTNDAFNVTNAGPRVTPGIGIRLVTPIGPFRVDVGYNPYPFDAGPAYFLQAADVPAGVSGRAICVSPGTTDPLTLPASGVGAASCPATYQPLPLRGLLSHLAFHFSIGQAF